MKLILFLFLISFHLHCFCQNNMIVFQSDFGLKDGAVSAMKGVCMSVSADLKLFDLTHEIPAYNIWEASFRLEQTARYWPQGTVFVSVVDPGVGTARKSVVVKTQSGHFIVTPDNGTLTHVAKSLGIESVREIDEVVNRRKNSEQSYTFHGRDVYAYTAARLASKSIRYEQVGNELPSKVVSIPFQEAEIKNSRITGSIPILDVQYGNVWTNIPAEMMQQLNIRNGQNIVTAIYKNGKKVRQLSLPFQHTFGQVSSGKPLAYLNSLMQLSFAINGGNFAKQYHVGSGNQWSVEVRKE